jgi:uncharacterized protein (DUF983 family)
MPQEPWTETELQVPRASQVVQLLGRALLLRCPHCGNTRVLRHWLALRDRCDQCGLRFERGEHDYFTGSILINFILVGLVSIVVVTGLVVASWPRVPWDLLQIVVPTLGVVALVAFFPFSKIMWLAFDIMLRPVTPAELEWHRSTTRKWSTDNAPPP